MKGGSTRNGGARVLARRRFAQCRLLLYLLRGVRKQLRTNGYLLRLLVRGVVFVCISIDSYPAFRN